MLSLGGIAPHRIIPVIVIEDVRHSSHIREALKMGGLNCAEITCRSEAAFAAIKIMAEDPDFIVGAGTVINTEQVEKVVLAGARFVVSPGLSSQVVKACINSDTRIIPGATSATEIMGALDLGITTLKFFPAEVNGGVGALEALHGPFPQIKFVPTGGVRTSNIADYLKLNYVTAVGGTWLAPTQLQVAGDYGKIVSRTIEAISLAAKKS